jgi:hypothetical protein
MNLGPSHHRVGISISVRIYRWSSTAVCKFHLHTVRTHADQSYGSYFHRSFRDHIRDAACTSDGVKHRYGVLSDKKSGFKCCTRGTAMSTGGSILGLTATCPTCLVPTFVSVIFGGITVGEAAYSNIYGAVLPPILSVATLLASLAYLSKSVKTRTNLVS